MSDDELHTKVATALERIASSRGDARYQASVDLTAIEMSPQQKINIASQFEKQIRRLLYADEIGKVGIIAFCAKLGKNGRRFLPDLKDIADRPTPPREPGSSTVGISVEEAAKAAYERINREK